MYIGIDIGGTKCAASLGKIEGDKIEILAREEVFNLGDFTIARSIIND